MEREELKIVRRLLASSGSARNNSSQEQLLALISDIANVNSASTRDVTPAAKQAQPALTAVDPFATLSRLAGAELSRRQTQIAVPEPEAKQTNASGGGSSAAGTVLKTIGLATGVGPLVAGLMSVFGGGKGGSKSEPVALPVFTPSPSINVSAGLNSDRSISAVQYGAGDQLRPISAEPAASAPTIQINVQAMDSRSFLDHSADIAAAVRRAMLQSSSLNDVVSEL